MPTSALAVIDLSGSWSAADDHAADCEPRDACPRLGATSAVSPPVPRMRSSVVRVTAGRRACGERRRSTKTPGPRAPMLRTGGTAPWTVWPSDAADLIALQQRLGRRSADPWRPPIGSPLVGGCWVCFPRGLSGPGKAGDRAWAGAVVLRGGELLDQSLRGGEAAAPYVPGLLAARIGGLLETVVLGLAVPPEVLLVDATGLDHPRRAGLALHLGAVLGLPTVGVTHRPLTGEGAWPADRRGATSPVRIGEDLVASWVRTRRRTRPVVVHPGWRVCLDDAVRLVLELTPRRRTPEPLRQARHLARRARADAAHPSAPDGSG